MGLFDEFDEPAPASSSPAPAVERQEWQEIRTDTTDAEVLEWIRKRLIGIYQFRAEDVHPDYAVITAADVRRIFEKNKRRLAGFDKSLLVVMLRPPPEWQFAGEQVGTGDQMWKYSPTTSSSSETTTSSGGKSLVELSREAR